MRIAVPIAGGGRIQAHGEAPHRRQGACRDPPRRDAMIRTLWCALVLACPAWNVSPQAGAQSEVEISFVEVCAAGDSFTMGDGLFGPDTSQTISYDFSMSSFPITNSQFGRFIVEGGYAERNFWTANGWKWKGKMAQPAYWKDGRFSGPNQPVVGVSWYEAVAYCN